MRRLLKDNVLVFTRYGGQELDDSGRLTDSLPSEFPAAGSLQTYREGAEQDVLPEGKSSKDAKMFYTGTLLRTSNQDKGTPADETTWNGYVYEVFDAGDNATTTILKGVAHYRAILIKKTEGAT